MNHLIRWRDDHHLLPLLLIASLILLVAIVAATLCSRGGGTAPDTRFVSLHRMQGAYDRVQPGRTSQPQLVRLGFDSRRLRARTLSGLGVQEYFMPRTSQAFDLLDPAIRSCFDAPDRCSVLIFPLQGAPVEEGGFLAAHAAPRDAGRIVFLLRSGRVAYKTVDGA